MINLYDKDLEKTMPLLRKIRFAELECAEFLSNSRECVKRFNALKTQSFMNGLECLKLHSIFY